MTAQIKLLVLVAATALVAALSAKLGYDFAMGKAAREELLIQKAGDAAAERAATAIAGLQPKYTTINKALETVIRELPPTPEACNATQAVLDQINTARKAP